MLADAQQLPNLASRSRQWWQGAVTDWLHGKAGEAQVTQAPPAPGEKPWLVAYAPLSWLYQCALMAGITWWLGSIASGLGWAVGLLALWTCLIAPGLRWARLLWQALLWSGPQQGGVRTRALCLLALPLLLALPWPDRTLVQGLVWAPDEALVRPEAEGVVQTVHAKDGAPVQPGDLLVTLHNPRLAAERERIAAQIAQAEQGAFGHLLADGTGSLGKAGQAGDALLRWQAELRHVEDQIEAMNVRARRAGTLVLPRAGDLPGRYIQRGELLGHVLGDALPRVRMAVHDDEVRQLRQDTRAVSVALRTPDVQAMPATLLRDGIGATRELPSPALSTDMGGQIATDPQDDKHLRTLRPVVTLDVALGVAHGIDAARLGERVWVRFDRGWAPLPWQAWRWIRHRAVTDFNPRQ
jgi:putative peptide zinc metalloprotease protein